jgi:tetratricopeptide (TPR) repeat protein
MSNQNRDVDDAERMIRLHALAWAAFPGLILGGGGGALLGMRYGGLGVLLGALAGFALVTLVIGGVTLLVAGRAGGIGSSVYFASGASTPAPRQYSLADALAMAGKYQAALDELERCAATWPDDPEPHIRRARLLRDRLQRYDDAAHAFRAALAAKSLDAGLALLLLREFDELCTRKLGDSRPLVPELARNADRRRGTPAGEWAKARLAEIKGQVPS